MSRAQIEELFTESGLDAEESPELLDVLASLDDAGDSTSAPAPSAALAAVFEGRPASVAPGGAVGPRKRAVAGVLVLALSGVGATGLSAAANTLPRPLQHHVSEFSRHYLPFDLPEPPERQPRSVPQPAHALPYLRAGDAGEASRSATDRPGAGAPDASTAPRPTEPASTGEAQPSTAPSPSSSPSPTASYAPTSTPSGSPSPSSGSTEDHTKSGGKDRDRGKNPQGPENKPGNSPDKGKPRPPGGGNEIPQPGQGQDPGDDGSGSPATPPDLPVPPLPLPDLPPTPELPGNGIDVTLD